MVLNNVDRVEAPPADLFYRDYILAQRPVILTNLFENAPLRRTDTLEKAKTAIANISVEIRPNYIAHLLSSAPTGAPRMMELSAYLDFMETEPTRLDICVEYPTPEPLLQQLPLDSYRQIRDESDLYSNMFVAGPSNSAHLHYDSDQRDVLLFQVFGSKRVVVIHPRETQKLDPLDQPELRRTSGVFLENASEAEKTAFLQYTNAFDTLLHPGETMFIPAMAWHYIEYLHLSMSIAYRLGRNQYNRRLAKLFPIPSVDVQALALQLSDETEAGLCHEEWLKELEAVSRSCHGSRTERRAVLDRLCLVIREKYFGLEPVYSIREWERRQALLKPT